MKLGPPHMITYRAKCRCGASWESTDRYAFDLLIASHLGHDLDSVPKPPRPA